jgi:hypothetical protein
VEQICLAENYNLILTLQGVFAHGIDVLGKIDFFAVGNRRNAFLVAAPQVAM